MQPLRIREAFVTRKSQTGQVPFNKTTTHDQYFKNICAFLAQVKGVQPADIEKEVLTSEDYTKVQELAQKSPLLYKTIAQNIIETALFNVFEKIKEEKPFSPPGAEFSTTTFYKLLRNIRADHDEFFPLRGFIDRRRLFSPKYAFVKNSELPPKVSLEDILTGKVTPAQAQAPKSDNPYAKYNVRTAAATPNGEFIFNSDFCQSLVDYAKLKGVKPKGKKYASNGGDIPDEYAYIEFVIMHEFMHYSNDDFYYQKIIPNADPQIINWVGDFRTNYLLVKSGYEQLPMGLFNDDINYDRQKEYIEMYNLVKQEFEKLTPPNQKLLSEMMRRLSDDHEPGNQQGKGEEVPGGITEKDIDKNGKQVEGQIERGKDTGKEEREAKTKADAEKQKSEQPGLEKQKLEPGEVDYTKVTPTFNWQTLVRRFIASAKPRYEETYSKPNRRAATGLEIARQRGAAAVKPAEKVMDHSDSSLAFVFDSSGSMSSVITTVFSNAMNLLKQPAFRKSDSLVYKFSGGHEIFRVNFSTNIAYKVAQPLDKKPVAKMKTTDVFNQHYGAGTVFDQALSGDISVAIKKKFNVIFFLDSDIMWGENLVHFLALLKSAPRNIFVIFDTRNTYIQFRQQTGIATPNITHFT